MPIELMPEEFGLVRHLFELHKRGREMVLGWMDMGLGYIKVDSKTNPKTALFLFPPISFIAGISESSQARNLIQEIPPLTIVVVPDEGWANLVKSEWAGKIQIQHRTRLSADSLNLKHLQELKKNLPLEFTLQKIDLETMNNSDKSFWDGVPFFFGSFESFLEKGFGFSIKKNDLTVSVAYTAFPFRGDFEVQVNTLDSPEYRRKGLATVVSAALIEEGLLKGVIPQWDAANPVSVKLALKLGYQNPDPYEVYYWMTSR